MAKVSLTLGESKSKADLTLESKTADLTWDDADFTWDSAETDTWDSTRLRADLETKTKNNLSLKAK